MPRPLTIPPNASPMVKRLFVIMHEGENGKPYTTADLAKKLNISTQGVRDFISGAAKSSRIIKEVPKTLGYSSEWWLHGTGPKRKDAEKRLSITDIQEVLAQFELTKNLNLKLQARMDAYEKENEDLRNRIAALEKKVGR